MITIKNLLNKVRWDKKEKPEDYEIAYIDRIAKKEVRISFKDVSNVEDNFMTVKEAVIPLHRIIKVYKKGKLVWERKKVKCL